MARIAGLRGNNVVYLNVYDLYENNSMLLNVGLGVFHTGVQLSKYPFVFDFKTTFAKSYCINI